MDTWKKHGTIWDIVGTQWEHGGIIGTVGRDIYIYNEWIAGAWEYRQFGYNGHRTTYSMTRRGNAQVITQVAVHF